jgi:molybdate transport system permease protein
MIIDKIIKLWTFFSFVLILLIFAPLIAPTLHAFTNSNISDLNSSILTQSIMISISTSIISLFIIIFLGTPLAYFLSKIRSKFLYSLSTLIQFPIFIPPTVAGIALILLFNDSSVVGNFLSSLGIKIPFTIFAVIIAQVFVASPFYIRTLQLGLININKNYFNSAHLLGASSIKIFIFIIIPNLRRSIFSGALLAWSRSMGELGATLLFAGNIFQETQTMPLAVLTSFENQNGFDLAVLIAFVSILISSIVLILFSYINEKFLTE